MIKNLRTFSCQICNSTHQKWVGRCNKCGAWNSLLEDVSSETIPKGLGAKKGRNIPFVGLKGTEQQPPRRISEIKEFDRVTGGGLVPGSAILVGGDPGIGKSTLLMQVVASLSDRFSCVYISGEEAIDQIRLRASRLKLTSSPVQLASATSVRDIIASLGEENHPMIVIIDSIQCMYVDNIESAPGTVSQVRSSAQELIRLAKKIGFSIILVGHVTKDGNIAGPRVLEHMVDTVLYFEGDKSNQFRILRAVKNRFGPADEIGVFKMTEAGLSEVSNPSALFLAEHNEGVSGASIFAGIEGTRPVLLEIQCLIAPSPQTSPRRAVIGWDSNRLAMILAVMESRYGVSIVNSEVYLNVAGGLKISETAADLAVAAAILSFCTETPVPQKTIIFGEIGLSGEIRAISQITPRLKEAEKLGFTKAIIPMIKNYEKKEGYESKIKIIQIKHLGDLIAMFPKYKN